MKEEAESSSQATSEVNHPDVPIPKEYTDPLLQGYHQATGCRVSLPYYQVNPE